MYKEEIEKIIVPVITRNDCYLWGTEILRGKKRTTLRIYIDSKKELILTIVRIYLKILIMNQT